MGHNIFISTVRKCALIALAIALPLLSCGPAAAQNTGTMASAPTTRAAPGGTKSSWAALSPGQRQALAPLATDWDRMGAAQQNKWLAIGNKFPSMTPEERSRIQNRMREWVALSPQQRRIARENYWRAKKINPDQKTADWQKYQQLPEEQKKSLAAAGAAKKRVANLPKVRKRNGPAQPKPAPVSTQAAPPPEPDSSILAPSAPPDIK